jgi:hypothetical protein
MTRERILFACLWWKGGLNRTNRPLDKIDEVVGVQITFAAPSQRTLLLLLSADQTQRNVQMGQ